MTWDRIAHMNAARDRKPATGGKLYRYATRRGPSPAKGSWERLAGTARARLDCSCDGAIAQYQFEVYGNQWEGL